MLMRIWCRGDKEMIATSRYCCCRRRTIELWRRASVAISGLKRQRTCSILHLVKGWMRHIVKERVFSKMRIRNSRSDSTTQEWAAIINSLTSETQVPWMGQEVQRSPLGVVPEYRFKRPTIETTSLKGTQCSGHLCQASCKNSSLS